MLLYDCLAPAERTAIVVRNNSDDLKEMPQKFAGRGVRYRIPRVRLALSDVSICLLLLKPGVTTRKNHHHGIEALLPIEGAFEVQLDGSVPREVRTDEIACFNSGRKHVVKGVQAGANGAAEAWVLRLYGYA